MSPILANKFSDNRPYISVKVFNDSVTALLDSGSNVSIMGNSALFLLKKYNLSLNYNVSVQVSTADGQEQNTLGFIHVPICLEGTSKTIKLLVVPSIAHKLILGMDFIRCFELSIDFRDNSFNSEMLNIFAIRAILNL